MERSVWGGCPDLFIELHSIYSFANGPSSDVNNLEIGIFAFADKVANLFFGLLTYGIARRIRWVINSKGVLIRIVRVSHGFHII